MWARSVSALPEQQSTDSFRAVRYNDAMIASTNDQATCSALSCGILEAAGGGDRAAAAVWFSTGQLLKPGKSVRI